MTVEYGGREVKIGDTITLENNRTNVTWTGPVVQVGELTPLPGVNLSGVAAFYLTTAINELGWKITAHTPKPEPLPTVPGYYESEQFPLDGSGFSHPYYLDRTGDWWKVLGRRAPVMVDTEHMQAVMPLTRLGSTSDEKEEA